MSGDDRMSGQVQTVLGPVAPGVLGNVLAHEHLTSLVPGPWLAGGQAEGGPTGALAADEQVNRAVGALSGLRELGYDTVVDLSPYGVVGRSDHGENVALLERISRESGVHIVLGSSTYLDPFSPRWVVEADIDELTARFIADVTTGIGTSSYRAGVLGEQATGLGEITPHEEAGLRAAARAHVETGVGLITHTTHGTMALEQVDILRQEGADLGRVVIGHMDIHPDLVYVRRVLDTGVSVAFDTVGKQHWDFFLTPLSADLSEGEYAKRAYFRPDDARIGALLELERLGYAGQIILSHDLTGAEVALNPETHGQWGYRYLGAVFLPEALRRGLDPAAAQAMVRDNPLRLLTMTRAGGA
ncbi:MAG: hypothetical protein QM607_10090 [Microbacterium sp.]